MDPELRFKPQKMLRCFFFMQKDHLFSYNFAEPKKVDSDLNKVSIIIFFQSTKSRKIFIYRLALIFRMDLKLTDLCKVEV